MKKILITGGAGYIGSHTADLLIQQGYKVVVLDNLSTGFREAVLNVELIVGDFGDKDLLNDLFKKHKFDAVMHFAASIEVEKSVQDPIKYYQNNVINSLNMLDIMVKHGISNLIFSSSAAVYGEPQYTPLDELHCQKPINSYGRSKLIIEEILPDYDKAYGLKSISLRYFNAAGADPKARLGPRHEPASHLIPLVLQAASGRKQAIKIFGTDYSTPDGTCVRDYIHVVDLCNAHLLALNNLFDCGKTDVFNLGNGKGFSVLHVIETAKKVTGRHIKVIKCERRLGDPEVLVADARKAHQKLGWRPKFPQLETIVKHAWQWELQQQGRRQEGEIRGLKPSVEALF
jgi:UDP-glucose 4-epimerase